MAVCDTVAAATSPVEILAKMSSGCACRRSSLVRLVEPQDGALLHALSVTFVVQDVLLRDVEPIAQLLVEVEPDKAGDVACAENAAEHEVSGGCDGSLTMLAETVQFVWARCVSRFRRVPTAQPG